MRNIKRVLGVLMVLVLVIGLVGCMEYTPPAPSSNEIGQKATEDAVKALVQNETLPKVTKSLERENLKRRIEFINQADRIGYLYLLSESGQLIKEVQVLGKVSSLNSYLTPMEEIKIIDHYGAVYSSVEYKDKHGILSEGSAVLTVQAPDLDGSYGENQNGIFWFTPDDIYQEWIGLYLYSSERLTFTTQPLLVEQVK